MPAFNIDEVFEIAEQIERNGVRFYRRAAELEYDHAKKDVLLGLAEMEVEHEQVFARLRADYAADHGGVIDLDDHAGAHLRAFADGKIFDFSRDPAAWLTGRETLGQVLDKAIGLEKDSAIFYLVLKDAMPANWGREHIDRIIDEEMAHIRLLTDEKNRLASL